MQAHIERFIRFLAAEKGLSAAYQVSVRQTLEEFSRFLGEGDADPSRVDIGSLAEFLRHLQSRGMARSSMRVEWCICAFFPLAGRNGHPGEGSLRIHGDAAAGADTASRAGSAYRFKTA